MVLTKLPKDTYQDSDHPSWVVLPVEGKKITNLSHSQQKTFLRQC